MGLRIARGKKVWEWEVIAFLHPLQRLKSGLKACQKDTWEFHKRVDGSCLSRFVFVEDGLHIVVCKLNQFQCNCCRVLLFGKRPQFHLVSLSELILSRSWGPRDGAKDSSLIGKEETNQSTRLQALGLLPPFLALSFIHLPYIVRLAKLDNK